MELLNRPIDVESVKLTAPPKHGTCLVTSEQLLIVWDDWGFVLDHESGERYYLAFYHPYYGWRACRWSKENGRPLDILPASESAIWVSTDAGKLIHISARDRVRATMLAFADRSILFLYAGTDNLWIRKSQDTKIMQLHLQKDSLAIVHEKRVHFQVDAMYPLADGAWAMVGNMTSCVFRSSALEEKIYEKSGVFYFLHPFIVQVDMDHYYYTEDPRYGWKKMPIGSEDMDDKIAFFTKHDDVCYAAVYRIQEEKTLLYRFSDESGTSAECIWKIEMYPYLSNFAFYNGLVCIANKEPLIVSGYKDMPKNHGFLVWNPRSNAFYEDIPRSSIMHARSVISRNLRIPESWLDRGRGKIYRRSDR